MRNREGRTGCVRSHAHAREDAVVLSIIPCIPTTHTELSCRSTHAGVDDDQPDTWRDRCWHLAIVTAAGARMPADAHLEHDARRCRHRQHA
jgi:hypothetical protein